ncbi:CYTH domain-containing protein [Canibacter zhoujuaniae]|uniref:CYTH domain-containing protein n=1 Tax=Canibacter zhoujuaniae TaxID=2708343 RepID=UPI00141F351D|nr:CYTH domain-containing protein [Canibacter zhoujuaniae]
MSKNASVHHEVELKFEAPVGAELPERWPAHLDPEPIQVVQLEAVYFDTPDRALAKVGTAVRRRAGGHDAGWHIKTRINETTQEETSWEFCDEIPAGAATHLNTLVPGSAERLEVVAEIRTERKITFLHDQATVARYEIADDAVVATDRTNGVTRAWREWEIEALTTDHSALQTLQEALLAAGAARSLADSKIARAAGALIPRALASGVAAERIAALAVQDLADRLAAQELQADTADVTTSERNTRIQELRGIARRIGANK